MPRASRALARSRYNHPVSAKLVRVVGPASLTAIAVNGMIGAGIFVMPATVAGLLGAASPIAYVLAGIAVMLIALSFAEAGSMFESAGGPYVYAREAFGRFVGFEVAWMFLLGRVTGAAAISNACTAYLGYFRPELASGLGRAAALTLSIGAIGAFNYVGVRYGALLVNVFTAGKLIPLVIFVGAGLFAFDPHAFTFTAAPEFGPLRQASLVLIYALGGFEFASVPSEEVIESRRNLPVALLVAVAIGATIYLLAQIVCLGTLPGLAQDATPLASAAARFLGAGGALLLTTGAVLSTTGTNCTILLIGPRMLYALAQGKQLPPVFGRVHERYRTPHISVVVFAAVTLGVALSGTFAQLATLNAIARLLYSITTCAAVPVLRRRFPPSKRAFTLPGGWMIPTLGVAASVFLLTGVTRTQAITGSLGILAGAAIYAIPAARRPSGRSAKPEERA